jgi:class 3 adenylate cyclase
VTEALNLRAVLFVDISDSSELYRQFGDVEASRIVLRFLSILGEIAVEQSGQVIDRIGDELMCTFPDVEHAAQAAVGMQKACSGFRAELAGSIRIAVRIGFHYGPLHESDGRIFGDTVHIAKRLVDSAKREQILVSGDVVKSIETGALVFRFVDTARLKGIAEPIRLLELIWNTRHATQFSPRSASHERSIARRLRLEGLKTELTVEEGQVLSLGREKPCDFICDLPVVSRLHARIDSHKGRFFVNDLSTNGTFIQGPVDSVDVRRAYRERVELTGEGLIGLGESPERGSAHTLYYCLLPKRT